jgi:hypothetical protein
VYSWGLNNWGQLGIGNQANSSTPTEIKEFRDIPIKKISGGAQHAIALTEAGEVYSWGKNEEGQLGIGDTYTEYSRKNMEDRMQIDDEERKANEEILKLFKLAEEKDDKDEIRKLRASKKQSAKKYSRMKDKEDSVEDVLYFTRPQKIPGLSNIHFIESGATYNYAIGAPVSAKPAQKAADKDMVAGTQSQGNMSVDVSKPDNSQNKEETKGKEDKKTEETVDTSGLNVVYSWGIGNSYVLGTKEEDTEYTPYKVAPEMYKNMNILSVSCGTLHVVVKATEAAKTEKDHTVAPIVHVASDKIEAHIAINSGIGQKRKVEDMEKPDSQNDVVKKPVEKVVNETIPVYVPEAAKEVKKSSDDGTKDEPKVGVDEVKSAMSDEDKENGDKDQSDHNNNTEEQKDMSQDVGDKKVEDAVIASPEKQKENSNIESKMEKFKLSDKKSDKPDRRPKLEETEDKDVDMKH